MQLGGGKELSRIIGGSAEAKGGRRNQRGSGRGAGLWRCCQRTAAEASAGEHRYARSHAMSGSQHRGGRQHAGQLILGLGSQQGDAPAMARRCAQRQGDQQRWGTAGKGLARQGCACPAPHVLMPSACARWGHWLSPTPPACLPASPALPLACAPAPTHTSRASA